MLKMIINIINTSVILTQHPPQPAGLFSLLISKVSSQKFDSQRRSVDPQLLHFLGYFVTDFLAVILVPQLLHIKGIFSSLDFY